MQDNELYPTEEMLQAKIDLLSKTNMVDYAGDVYKELHKKDLPEEMEAKKSDLINKLEEVETNCQKMIDLKKDEKKLNELKENHLFNAVYLEEHFNINKEDIDAVYPYAKFQYECGKYDSAIEYLELFVALNIDPQKGLMALWGKLASEILMSKWDKAENDINQIRDAIEDPRLSLNPLKQLQQRLWLIHWSLFVYFHQPNASVTMLDLFLTNERYLRAIEFKAPWMLRYLTVAAILTKHRLPELVKLIKQECPNNYSDPVTEFIRLLYVKFDFDGAEKVLEKCEFVLNADYFVKEPESEGRQIVSEFLRAGRLAICEAFCKIHSTISITMMANKLGLELEEAEWWIVNLIRGAKLDAKIDSANNLVIVSSQVPSVYQQLIDKTKTLSLRASVLASNIERGKGQPSKEEKLSDDHNLDE